MYRNVNTMRSQLNSAILLFCLILSVHSVIAVENNSDTDAAVPSDKATSSKRDQYIQQYLDQIEETEKLHGAMDPQLGEQFLGLGLLYKNHGQYQKAIEVLNRSLQIKRVNDGIQSMDQIPILKALIAANAEAKNWDELDGNYHLLLWVYQRNLDPGDPELLPVIDAVGNWKLYAYRNALLKETPASTLYDLVDMYQSTVNLMTKLYGKNDSRLIRPLKGLCIARYQMITQIENTPLNEFQGYEQRTRMEMRCYPVLNPVTGRIDTVCGNEEVPNPGYYVSKQAIKNQRVGEEMNTIRNNLNRIVKISAAHPSLPVIERADALINMGDWYFINNKKNTAIDNYNQAYQLLSSEEGNAELIEKLFGKPVRIPFGRIASSGTEEETGNISKPYVRLSFAVTAEGKARHIKIIEQSNPESYRIRKLAKNIIEDAIFRPRLEDGKPVATPETELVLSGDILQTSSNQHVDRQNSIYSRLPIHN